MRWVKVGYSPIIPINHCKHQIIELDDISVNIFNHVTYLLSRDQFCLLVHVCTYRYVWLAARPVVRPNRPQLVEFSLEVKYYYTNRSASLS